MAPAPAAEFSSRIGDSWYLEPREGAEGGSLYDEVPPNYQALFDGQAQASGNNSVAMPFEVWQEAFGVPVAVLLGEDDVALPLGDLGWTRFAELLGVAPIPVPGSHEACFTRPAELAESSLKA